MLLIILRGLLWILISGVCIEYSENIPTHIRRTCLEYPKDYSVLSIHPGYSIVRDLDTNIS